MDLLIVPRTLMDVNHAEKFSGGHSEHNFYCFKSVMNDLATIQELNGSDMIRSRILKIRGVQVMLAPDLAQLYNVTTSSSTASSSLTRRRSSMSARRSTISARNALRSLRSTSPTSPTSWRRFNSFAHPKRFLLYYPQTRNRIFNRRTETRKEQPTT